MAVRGRVTSAATVIILVSSFLSVPADAKTTVAAVAGTSADNRVTTTYQQQQTSGSLPQKSTVDHVKVADQSTHQPQQTSTDHSPTQNPVDHHTDHSATHGRNHTDDHDKCPPDGEEGLRYKVAKFDFHHVEIPFIVAVWILFVTYAKIGNIHRTVCSFLSSSSLSKLV